MRKDLTLMLYLVFLFSIFIHELGHIFICKILNLKIGTFKLGLMGFSAKSLNFKEIEIKYKILVFLSGPIFNFLIAIIMFNFSVNFYLKEQIMYINLLLGIFNLLPIIPLDGGNILISCLNYKFNINESIKISLIVSKVSLIILSMLYCVFILVLKNLWILIFIFYLWYLYLKEDRKFEFYLKIHKRYEDIIKVNHNNPLITKKSACNIEKNVLK